MNTIYLKGEKGEWKEFKYEKLSDLQNDFNRLNIEIGARATVGEWATVGARAKVGEGATIGEYNSMFALNLYKYAVSAYTTQGIEYIQLGCYLRTREEWNNNFWNNESEFPNDNSEKSNARLRAFNVACSFLDSLNK